MKNVMTVLLLIFSLNAFTQTYQDEVLQFQKELNESYQDPKKSPLDSVSIKSFQGHEFFPISKKYRVEATFIRTPNEKPFEIPTSSGKTKTFAKYGEFHFILKGKKRRLNVYQNQHLKAGYEDYLFLPFLDLTNGVTTYGAGRYIDTRIPKSDKVIIDFNKAYNPYCAYSNNYNCPIVPMENFLDTEVEAGIRYHSKDQ